MATIFLLARQLNRLAVSIRVIDDVFCDGHSTFVTSRASYTVDARQLHAMPILQSAYAWSKLDRVGVLRATPVVGCNLDELHRTQRCAALRKTIYQHHDPRRNFAI